LLTIAASTKSAQIPFSSWLPAAIAAPTPVSALVHSSTLVTAGVFILIRLSHHISLYPIVGTILLTVSTITIIISGLSALVESDIKKVIALSTLRQLGLIISAISLNLPQLATFHIITHAMFKALLFITAGTIISKNNHYQDIRRFGIGLNSTPITTTSASISLLALSGTPFLAGFYSKDVIIELMLGGG
jgi:NADH-ubiquinone oxidoreductase chain 5